MRAGTTIPISPRGGAPPPPDAFQPPLGRAIAAAAAARGQPATEPLKDGGRRPAPWRARDTCCTRWACCCAQRGPSGCPRPLRPPRSPSSVRRRRVRRGGASGHGLRVQGGRGAGRPEPAGTARVCASLPKPRGSLVALPEL